MSEREELLKRKSYTVIIANLWYLGLGLRKYTVDDLAYINFSQDEEYLILGYL